MRKWLLFGSCAILLALAAGAFTHIRRAPSRKISAAQASVAEAATRDLSLPGKIQAQHVVPVGVTVTGTIDSFLVEVGQDVAEGQLLAHISSQGLESAREEAARSVQNAQEKVNSIEGRIVASRLEASRARADANRSRDRFERAGKAYQRQQMLHREGATPRLVYEKSEREFETARNDFTSLDELARQADSRVAGLIQELESAKRALDERTAELETATAQTAGAEVRSPVSGVLVARHGESGKMVGPEEAKDLLEIAVDLAHLVVVIQPDPGTLKRIHPGQDALIFVADLPGAIPGNVKDAGANETTVEFISPSAVIRPGTTAQVRLQLE
jgi:multidrug resistance efflux pump